jgi:hypothetical protein
MDRPFIFGLLFRLSNKKGVNMQIAAITQAMPVLNIQKAG